MYLPRKESISLVQWLSWIWLFANQWTAAPQSSLSITNSWGLFKLMSIESVMPSSYRILCCPLLFPPSLFPCIRVFSNESVLRMRWPKYWSFSFNISPSNEFQDWFPLGWTGWISLNIRISQKVFRKEKLSSSRIHCCYIIPSTELD